MYQISIEECSITNLQLPSNIERLEELSQNLWWSWIPRSRELFRYLDYHLWNSTKHNPTIILNKISTDRLEWAAKDEKFLELYNKVIQKFDEDLHGSSNWFMETLSKPFENPVAYFSMEFGLHQSIPIYSGGLGVLAGDTCKQASDLGIPFIGIGFLYHQGYFTQAMPADGWQEAHFKKINFDNISLFPVMNSDGDRLKVRIDFGDAPVHFQVWELKVGRVTLFLIDTDIDENKPWYRGLSSRLYGGDHEMRLNQEIILGFGGAKLLDTLNIKPSVWHLNEGHCAFVSLQRLRKQVKQGSNFQEALEIVRNSTVFTTHTPVPAGHDKFDLDQIADKFDDMWHDLKITKEQFMLLGIDENEENPRFNMTVLGFKTAHLVNGVSKLHTKVTRDMWDSLIKNDQTKTDLIDITNGVHLLTWISGPMRRLFTKFIDPSWVNKVDNFQLWEKIKGIPNKEIWYAHTESKNRLFSFMREAARDYRIQSIMSSDQILASGTFLDPNALTIGFARRFATYKRANLIFNDIDRLQKIINDSSRPVQIIFAGKSHPADEHGKYILQQIYEQALEVTNAGRIAFIENYDMHIARFLVQGVDIWLNNPIRPHEASGTSGIKASINGIPHFSILDGWWGESYNGKNGWVIGNEDTYENDKTRDKADADSLYDILQNNIIQTYYNRDTNGIPNDWVEICKNAIQTVAPQFSAARMVKDYTNKMYVKSAHL